MRYISLLFFFFTFNLCSYAQRNLPDDEQLKEMLTIIPNTEDEYELEDIATQKLLAAWLLPDTVYLYKQFDTAVHNGDLTERLFLGPLLLLEIDMTENKAKIVLSILERIKIKYSNDATYNFFFQTYDYYYAKIFGSYEKLNKTSSVLIDRFEQGNIPENGIGNSVYKHIEILYHSKLLSLKHLGKTKEYNTFLKSYYLKYPEQTKSVYIITQYQNKNYKEVAKFHSDTLINPFDRINIALSLVKLKQNKNAKIHFDWLLNALKNKDKNDFREQYAIPFTDENWGETTYNLGIEQLYEMYKFYLSLKDITNACFLKNIIEKAILDLPNQHNPYSRNRYLASPEFEKELQKNILEHNEEIQTIEKQIKIDNIACQ